MNDIVENPLLKEGLRYIEQIEFEILDEEASIKYIFSENYRKQKTQLLKKAKAYDYIKLPYALRKVAMFVLIACSATLAITFSIPAARKQAIKISN